MGTEPCFTVCPRDFSSQYFSFQTIHALRADLFGRDHSEALNASSDLNLYIPQLSLLLHYIRWDRADIVGFSIASSCITSSQTQIRHHTCKEKMVSLCIAIYNVKSVIYAKKMMLLL